MKKELSVRGGKKLICPFILKPFENCYCTSTSSLLTEATIHYCGGNYQKCYIYEKNMQLLGEVNALSPEKGI